MQPWIGVDLDGTLAVYNEWVGPEDIGDIIPLMAERIVRWINVDKIEVRIFTARVAGDREGIPPRVTIKLIQDWLEKNGLPRLEVTCTKDYGMVELYDDRTVQVEFNTGRLVGESTMEHRKILKDKQEGEV